MPNKISLAMAAVAMVMVIVIGEGLKIALKSATFTSFGSGDVNTMMSVAGGLLLVMACLDISARVTK